MKITRIQPKFFTNKSQYKKYSNTEYSRLSSKNINDTVTFKNKKRNAAGIAALLLLLSASSAKPQPEITPNNEPARPAIVTKAPRRKLPEIEDLQNADTKAETEIKPEEPEEKIPVKTKGEEMAELAEKFLDFKENDMEEVCGYDLPDGRWCAAFVKYLADEIYGDALPEWYTKDGYNKCTDVLYYAKENDAAFDDYTTAEIGDIVIFNIGKNKACHMGIVTKIEDDTITTIEGNAGDGIVVTKTYNLTENPDRVNSFVRISQNKEQKTDTTADLG